jgi:predicted dehydrogenase
VGVIGVGRIGRVHIESIQSIKNASVVMVSVSHPVGGSLLHAWPE